MKTKLILVTAIAIQLPVNTIGNKVIYRTTYESENQVIITGNNFQFGSSDDYMKNGDRYTLVSLDNIEYINTSEIRTVSKTFEVGYKRKPKTNKTDSPFSKLVSKLEIEALDDNTDKTELLSDMIMVCKVSVTSVMKRIYLVNSDNKTVRDMYNESYQGVFDSYDDLPLFMTGLTSDHFQTCFLTLFEMMIKARKENNVRWLTDKSDYDVTNKRVFISDLGHCDVKTKLKSMTGIQYLYNQIRKSISNFDTFKTCENRYSYTLVSLDSLLGFNTDSDNTDYLNSEAENCVYKRFSYAITDNYTDYALNNYANELYDKLVNTDTQRKCIAKRLQNTTLGYKAIANSTGIKLASVKSCFRVLKDKVIHNGIDKEVHKRLENNANDTLFTGNGYTRTIKGLKFHNGTIKLNRGKNDRNVSYTVKAISKRENIKAYKAVKTIDSICYAMGKHFNDSVSTLSMTYSKSDFVGVFTYDIYKSFVKRVTIENRLDLFFKGNIKRDTIKYDTFYNHLSDIYDSVNIVPFNTCVLSDKDLTTIKTHCVYNPVWISLTDKGITEKMYNKSVYDYRDNIYSTGNKFVDTSLYDCTDIIKDINYSEFKGTTSKTQYIKPHYIDVILFETALLKFKKNVYKR